MRWLGKWIGFFAISFLFQPPARAQLVLITIVRPFQAHHLAGDVVDSTGAPVAGVVVEECDALFTPLQPRGPKGEPVSGVLPRDCDREPKHVLASTTTDANGHFAFPPTKWERHTIYM
jgi:hypothetical protein